MSVAHQELRSSLILINRLQPKKLRSLALPFTVLEWTLPTVPRPSHSATSKPSTVNSQDNSSVASDVSPTDSNGAQEDFTESFSFALVNGALGVFEVHGRRIRDFRPKWPDSSFVSSEGLVTAMAYRLPHVVMGDRLGNIRWWDVTTGQSSSFNTHREGIRRIKFSPVVPGDRSLGRIAVLFNDNTFSVFDLVSEKSSMSCFFSYLVFVSYVATYLHEVKPVTGSAKSQVGFTRSISQFPITDSVSRNPCAGT